MRMRGTSWLACLLGMLACAESPDEGVLVPVAEAPFLEIIFVSGEVEHNAIFNSPRTGSAVFQATNRSGRPLRFRGVNGKQPLSRLAVRDGGPWVEDEPSWLGCGTGLAEGVLEPGASASTDVHVPSPDVEFRVGVGCWEDVGGECPPWPAWNWSWSEAMVLSRAIRDATIPAEQDDG